LCARCAESQDTAHARALRVGGLILLGVLAVVLLALATTRTTSVAPLPSDTRTPPRLAVEPARAAPAVASGATFDSGPCCNCSAERVVTLGTVGPGARIGDRWQGTPDTVSSDTLHAAHDLRSNPYKTYKLRLIRKTTKQKYWRITDIWGCDGPAMDFTP
jgi:hypothetical protein